MTSNVFVSRRLKYKTASLCYLPGKKTERKQTGQWAACWSWWYNFLCVWEWWMMSSSVLHCLFLSLNVNECFRLQSLCRFEICSWWQTLERDNTFSWSLACLLPQMAFMEVCWWQNHQDAIYDIIYILFRQQASFRSRRLISFHRFLFFSTSAFTCFKTKKFWLSVKHIAYIYEPIRSQIELLLCQMLIYGKKIT